MASIHETFTFRVGDTRNAVTFTFDLEEGFLDINIKEVHAECDYRVQPGDFLTLVKRLDKLAKFSEDRQMESIL